VSLKPADKEETDPMSVDTFFDMRIPEPAAQAGMEICAVARLHASARI
jgi:hypothetical protein